MPCLKRRRIGFSIGSAYTCSCVQFCMSFLLVVKYPTTTAVRILLQTFRRKSAKTRPTSAGLGEAVLARDDRRCNGLADPPGRRKHSIAVHHGAPGTLRFGVYLCALPWGCHARRHRTRIALWSHVILATDAMMLTTPEGVWAPADLLSGDGGVNG